MKISKDNRDKIQSDCIEYFKTGLCAAKKVTFIDELYSNPKKAMHWLKMRVNDDRNHDDNHPRFQPLYIETTKETLPPHKRVLQYDENYQIYPDDCNDDHMWTVLKTIGLKIRKEFS